MSAPASNPPYATYPPPSYPTTPTYAPPLPSQYGMAPPPGALNPNPQLAGVGQRAIAVIIDTILLAVVAIVIILPLALVGVVFGGYTFALLGIVFVVFLLGLLYFSYFESTSGQTPGKKVMGIRVIDIATRQPPVMGKALIRNLCRIVDGFFFYIVGLIVTMTNAQKQRIGDMAAGTLVITA